MAAEKEEVRVQVDGRTLTISNLHKVLYPRTGFTKGEVLSYYAQVAPVLLPHLRDRCVTRIRWPHGVAESSFFEKNTPAGTPSWVRTAKVPTTGSRAQSTSDTLVFPIVDEQGDRRDRVQAGARERTSGARFRGVRAARDGLRRDASVGSVPSADLGRLLGDLGGCILPAR